MARRSVVVSCEHAGNRVPAALAGFFAGRRRLLDSHRGYDAGALEMAAALSRSLHAPLRAFRVSRLVIDANRSAAHPGIFSSCMAPATETFKNRLLKCCYLPYRNGLRDLIRQRAERAGAVVHIAVHSFTPVLGGRRRTADVGLLYDPSRSAERRLAAAWREGLLRRDGCLRVRRNYPYRGTSDGVTAWLRGLFPDSLYAGIELEVNQRFVRQGPARWRELRQLLALTAGEALQALR